MATLGQKYPAPILDHLDVLQKFVDKFLPDFPDLTKVFMLASQVDVDMLHDAARNVWGGAGGDKAAAQGALSDLQNQLNTAPGYLATGWQGPAFNAFVTYAGRLGGEAGAGAAGFGNVGKAIEDYASSLEQTWADVVAFDVAALFTAIGFVVGLIGGGIGALVGALVGAFIGIVGAVLGVFIPKLVAAQTAAQNILNALPSLTSPGNSDFPATNWTPKDGN